MHLGIRIPSLLVFDQLIEYCRNLGRNAKRILHFDDIRDIIYILTAFIIASLFFVFVLIFNAGYLFVASIVVAPFNRSPIQ